MRINRNTLIGALPRLEAMIADGKDYELTVTPYKEKRSGQSNRYLWELIDKVAEKINLDHIEVYRNEIRKIGKKRVAEVSENAYDTVCHVWALQGSGWFIDRIDQGDHEGMVLIHMYYGSSCYTTEEMARLIDNVKQDCVALGIDPSTPEELVMMQE